MKKTMVFLLSLTIAFMPSLVFASGGFAPWSITSQVAQGASTILTGSKEVILNGAKKIATGTAKITPTASQVSKVLARGAAGYALSVAVEQLLGAVDWVLDPANNQIVYTDPAAPCYSQSCIPQPYAYGYVIQGGLSDGRVFTSVSAACAWYDEKDGNAWYGNLTAKGGGVAVGGCYGASGALIVSVSALVNPNYDPQAEEEEEQKTLPLEVVAQQVISNAESGDTNAQFATTAAAADIINEAENDNVKARPIVQQLENTQSIPTDQTAQGDAVPKDDTANPSSSPATSVPPMDISLDFPIFCDWAPSVCQAAKVVITKPQEWADSVSTAYTDAVDWFKKEPDKDEKEQVDIVTPEAFDTSIFTKDRFQVSRQCPVPEQHTITLSGVSVNFSFDMTPLCRVLELARPALVACSYLYAGYIIIGAARNG